MRRMAVSIMAATMLMGGAINLAVAEGTPSAPNAKVYIISPENGKSVRGPVTVRFGLSGMGVAPVGVQVANTGHHHLLINVDELPDLTQPLPSDERHRHFGGGQTEVVLDLEPGTYTLQLILGDYNHVPHDPPLISEQIRIKVKK